MCFFPWFLDRCVFLVFLVLLLLYVQYMRRLRTSSASHRWEIRFLFKHFSLLFVCFIFLFPFFPVRIALIWFKRNFNLKSQPIEERIFISSPSFQFYFWFFASNNRKKWWPFRQNGQKCMCILLYLPSMDGFEQSSMCFTKTDRQSFLSSFRFIEKKLWFSTKSEYLTLNQRYSCPQHGFIDSVNIL